MPAPSVKFTPAHPSAPWRVYHRGKSYWFKNEAGARAKAKDLAGNRGAFSPRELDEYRHAQEILQGVPLLVAVRHYMERQSGETETTVAEACERLKKESAGRPDYVEKRAYYFQRLTGKLGAVRLGAVTPDQIESVLASTASPWMRNSMLVHYRILFRWARRMRLTRNDPTEGITERKVTPSKVVLTLADTAHLVETCAAAMPELLPAVALQLFMGIRTSEITRLCWGAVRHGEFVDIAPDVAKTHERRVIDWWPPRLTALVAGRHDADAPIAPHPASYEAAKFALMRACRLTKKDFRFGQNAMRHSFASYAVAYHENAGRVALLMGQRDVNVLFRHYRNYATKSDGAAYFGLVPPA